MRQEQLTHLGECALTLTRSALTVIQSMKAAGKTKKVMIRNPYVRAGYAPVTPADLPAQRVYTQAFEKLCPDIPIIAEEKDPDRPHSAIAAHIKKPVWVVDGLDGSSNFSDGKLFGYGTQCALLFPDGSVRIAIVGNAVTGDIFGYYGNTGVFWINAKTSKQKLVSTISRKRTLAGHVGWRRPSLNQYHPLSQTLLESGKIGRIGERLGGIGTTMAELLTDEIGVFALRLHHEMPWDAIPAYALCDAAGMVFMKPTTNGKAFEQWRPTLAKKYG
jgi:3'-phosphoadenosine 5'-phosphosulfate (PAPS) 3'-phosphatase